MRNALVVTAGLIVLGGCGGGGDDGPGPDANEGPVERWSFPTTLNRDLDVLFVIDNSGSMAGEQGSLAANFPSFIGVLQTIAGGLPNVHIGIVSSNVGAAGQASVPGCAGQGDDGNLLVKAGCTGLTGQFISDVADGQGSRVKNYTGNLDTLFSCMATLGTGGCGFEMHLESMFRSLQPGKNPNFYRPSANLAVIVLADEDDCSTEMGAMFGDPTAGLNSPLGPRTSFRCFEFGVKCDDDVAPRAFGTKLGCQPSASSQYMYEVTKYVDFLQSLKEDPSLVAVGGIAGIDDAMHTVVVGPDPNTPANPTVEKSCFILDPNDPNDGATPPIRLAAFLRSFSDRHVESTVCAANLDDSMRAMGGMIKRMIGDPCVYQELKDGNPATSEIDYDCTVKDVRNPRSANRVEVVLASCAANGGAPPCWQIVPNPGQCPDAVDMLALEIERGGAMPPAGTVVEATCKAQ